MLKQYSSLYVHNRNTHFRFFHTKRTYFTSKKQTQFQQIFVKNAKKEVYDFYIIYSVSNDSNFSSTSLVLCVVHVCFILFNIFIGVLTIIFQQKKSVIYTIYT